MKLLVCKYKSEMFAQSQKSFAQTHVRVSVTLRNSGPGTPQGLDDRLKYFTNKPKFLCGLMYYAVLSSAQQTYFCPKTKHVKQSSVSSRVQQLCFGSFGLT